METTIVHIGGSILGKLVCSFGWSSKWDDAMYENQQQHPDFEKHRLLGLGRELLHSLGVSGRGVLGRVA